MDWLYVFMICLALILDLCATKKLMNLKTFDKKVKNTNLILIWCVPFIWAIIVLSYSEEPPKKGKKDKYTYMSTGYPQG